MHEIKFDGYRLLARIDGGRVRLKTRSGLDWTAKFPSVQKALERLPVVAAFLDGEVMVETERGTPDFGALQQDLSEGRSDRFCYYLFDLLHLDGIDLTRASLHRPQGARSPGCSPATTTACSSSASTSPRRGDIVLKHACRLSLEGIVSKLASAPYRSGRTQGLAQVEMHRQRRVRRHRLRALDHPAPHRRLARARLFRQGQARLRRPRRLGLLDRGGRRPLAPARSDPHRGPGARRRCRRRRCAATCAGPSRCWWRRSRCAAGPPTASCATPCSRACATTSRRPTSPRRSPP